MSTAVLLAAGLLAVVHLFAHHLRFAGRVPRSIWLSGAGGASVAYVFLHLLPELSEYQEHLSEWRLLAFMEQHVYLLALVGLSSFYGLERLAISSRREQPGEEEHARTSDGVFWLHIASFAIYNALIGYLLTHREEESLARLALFTIAMALHFLVNDVGLEEHHKELYGQRGRWVLVAALATGVVLGAVVEISERAIGVLVAFLAGGIVLNVLKEELPENRKSRFSAFLAGATIYAALLLAG